MARPAKEPIEKRTHWLKFRINETERAQIGTMAEKTGLSLSEYMRRMALNGHIEIRESQADFELIRALERIGVNLNQITKKLNTTGQLQSHSHAATLKRINEHLDALQGL